MFSLTLKPSIADGPPLGLARSIVNCGAAASCSTQYGSVTSLSQTPEARWPPSGAGISLMFETTNSARLPDAARADGTLESMVPAPRAPADSTSNVARDKSSFDIFTGSSIGG